MAKPIPFLMSDESVNTYGFRVLTAGIDISDFEANPVGYWNHRNEDEYKEKGLLPLFRWQNLRKEGALLKGDLMPDEGDEEAMQVYGKIERGFINACSIAFEPLEWSEAPELMLPGQTRPTVTKCKLIECSPVGLPGNSNALKLRDKAGKIISLNAANADDVLNSFQLTKKQNQMSAEKSTLLIALGSVLGLNISDEQTALSAVSKLKADKEAAEQKSKDLQNTLSKDIIDEAVAEELIEETERADFEEMGKTSLSALRKTVQKLRAAKKPADAAKPANDQPGKTISQELRELANKGGGTNTTASASAECEYDVLRKSNPAELNRIARDEPERYEQLKAEKLNKVSALARKGASVQRS